MTITDEILTGVTKFSEWEIGGGRFTGAGSQIDTLNAWRENSGHSFNLKNLAQRRYVGWEEQTHGINLGYSSDATQETARRMARWFFARPNGQPGAIRYGELLAIGYGTSPSFYTYGDRTIGINLVNTASPAYEWRIIGRPGTGGDPVLTGDDVAIWNDHDAAGFLIYFDRDLGVDLGWPDSVTLTDQARRKFWEAVKKAGQEWVRSYVAGL